MDQVSPPTLYLTITDVLFGMGIFSLFFPLVAAVLTVWLCVLIFRTRPQFEYFAYLAATFYPILLGVLGASLSMAHVIYEIGDTGIANLEPYLFARAYGELLARLITGSLLTCIFLPLGILALMIRRPPSS